MDGVTGRFNLQLAKTVFLVLNEAVVSKDDDSVLKGLITESTIRVEPKGKEVMVFKNRLHIAMATNENWILPTGEDSRRYYINLISDEYKLVNNPKHSIGECKTYFERIWGEVNGDGTAAMLHDLLRVNIEEWTPIFALVTTEELRNQQDLSSSTLDKAFFNFLHAGDFPSILTRGGEWRASTKELRAIMLEQTPRLRNASARQISDIVEKYGATKTRINGANFWKFPPLEEMRRRYCGLHSRDVEVLFKGTMENEWGCVAPTF